MRITSKTAVIERDVKDVLLSKKSKESDFGEVVDGLSRDFFKNKIGMSSGKFNFLIED